MRSDRGTTQDRHAETDHDAGNEPSGEPGERPNRGDHERRGECAKLERGVCRARDRTPEQCRESGPRDGDYDPENREWVGTARRCGCRGDQDDDGRPDYDWTGDRTAEQRSSGGHSPVATPNPKPVVEIRVVVEQVVEDQFRVGGEQPQGGTPCEENGHDDREGDRHGRSGVETHDRREGQRRSPELQDDPIHQGDEASRQYHEDDESCCTGLEPHGVGDERQCGDDDSAAISVEPFVDVPIESRELRCRRQKQGDDGAVTRIDRSGRDEHCHDEYLSHERNHSVPWSQRDEASPGEQGDDPVHQRGSGVTTPSDDGRRGRG